MDNLLQRLQSERELLTRVRDNTYTNLKNGEYSTNDEQLNKAITLIAEADNHLNQIDRFNEQLNNYTQSCCFKWFGIVPRHFSVKLLLMNCEQSCIMTNILDLKLNAFRSGLSENVHNLLNK